MWWSPSAAAASAAPMRRSQRWPGAAKSSRMASPCSRAGPLPRQGSETFPSLRCPARRIRRWRHGGRWCSRCWTGCPGFCRDRRRPCRSSARSPQASVSRRSSCSERSRADGRRWLSANCRPQRSPAPTHGSPCRPAQRGLLRARRSMLICCGTDMSSDMTDPPLPKSRDNVDQDQFLTILSREDALKRFEAALFPRAVPSEPRRLSDALGCALAEDIVAPIDVPPFDRSNVDGFAVRSADLGSASEAAPVRIMLNDEVIACGTAPERPVLSGTATSIATGGPLPRGADAIVMVEHTQPAGARAIEIRRAASPGQFVSCAGSDIARGEALLRAGTVIGSREIGMLAACGIAEISVARRPRVAVISTGDELVQPGEPLRPAEIYDTNGAIVTSAIRENGGDPVFLGAVPDVERELESVMRNALDSCEMLVLSG